MSAYGRKENHMQSKFEKSILKPLVEMALISEMKTIQDILHPNKMAK